MCGRFARYSDTETFAGMLGLADAYPVLQEQFNQPPGLYCLVAAADPHAPEHFSMQTYYWGFTPSWAQSASKSMVNARSESAAVKPFFRKAFHKRRCVVAADCYYEWQRREGRKQPYAIRPVAQGPYFMAGIWSVAKSLPPEHPAAGQRTFCVLTRNADPEISHIHDRMPVMLTTQGARAWLSPGEQTDDLEARLEDLRHRDFTNWPVSSAINKPDNNGRDLLTPVEADGRPVSRQQSLL